MEKKTIEEITKAVLVYCEEVCPNVGDGHKETVNSGTIIHSKDRAWVWLDGLGSRIYINDNMSRATATAMYAILGLAERDAVAECDKTWNAECEDLKSKKESIYSELLAERARNTALVEALEKIKQEHGYRYTYGDGFGNVTEKRLNSLGVAIDLLIAANTEKGGVNG